MGLLTVRFLDASGAVLMERTVEGNAVELGPYSAGTDRRPPFKDFASNNRPMNDATRRYGGQALLEYAREIGAGRAADPRVGDRLVSVDVNGTGPIPVMEAFATLSKEQAAASVIAIARGAKHQAIARRARFKIVPHG